MSFLRNGQLFDQNTEKRSSFYLIDDERGKMITNPTDEADIQAKNEDQKIDDRVSSRALPSSSRHWSSFRNPRIVRVSRSFGGKDRHSKVCTIRGLRDRRIRLSVPTAIQLYDLQEKLGLNQPSKVIDWLLDATKQDIDNLPPLQMPQGFGQFHQHMFSDYNMGSRNLNDLLLSHEPSTSQFSLSPFFPISNSTYARKHGVKINDNVDVDDEVDDTGRAKSSKYWDINLGLRPRDNKALQGGPLDDEKGKSIEMNDVLEKNAGISDHHYAQLSAQNFFPSFGYSSLPQGSTNNPMPYSYNHWDPSNLSLSQFSGFQQQMAEHSSISSAIYPPTSAAPSLLPTYPSHFTASTENDSRQLNQFQLLSSSLSQPIVSSMPMGLQQLKQFQTNSYSKFLHPHDGKHTQDDDHEKEPS